MAAPIRLDQQQMDDLRVICHLSSETVGAVVDHLGRLEPTPVRPNKLFSAAAEVMGEKAEAAPPLVRLALILHDWLRQGRFTVDEILEGVRLSLDFDSDSNDEDRAKWKQIEGSFGELLKLKILRLAARAIDLSYEHANLLRGARLLTEIRPIFSNDAGSIEGAVVSHSLILRFDSIDGPHEIAFSAEEDDIKELAEQCHRALTKAATARNVMEKANVPTMISGANDV